MRLDKIQHWLDATTHDSDGEPPSSKATVQHDRDHGHASKRRRLNPFTPPGSNQTERSNMASPTRGSSPPNKRPLDDETPRAKRIQVPAAASSSGLSQDSSLPPADCSPSSRRSGRVSPRKQLRRLHLDSRGLDVRELAMFRAAMPTGLQELVDGVAAISRGKRVVARDTQSALEEAAKSDVEFRWALLDDHHLSDDPAVAGQTPSPHDVRHVVDAAIRCSTRDHPEANWNMMVHDQVLQMAFQPRGKPRYSHLVNFVGCTTATIMAEYGNPTLTKRVDFCVCIEPENDASAPDFPSAAARARAVMPRRIVNFTDFAPLYDCFIALSIETKKPSENFDAARLQLGVWEMARWSFLRALETAGRIGAAATDEAPGATTATSRLPAFLPSIIVQGHEWILLVTTTEGERTVLWQKVIIGSTSSSIGVYQIVRALQYLGRWARDVHWPCLRALVEAIPDVVCDNNDVDDE
ncbi:hypothetical protein ARSEF1564_004932 [Beauveria bassiana]